MLTIGRSLWCGSAVLDEMVWSSNSDASRQQHQSEVRLGVDVVRVGCITQLA